MLASKAESPRPTLSERLAKRLAALFGVVALLGLLHTFFGFGVAFAISATFGLDAAEILHGPADYLAASYMVVIPLFNGLDAKLNSAAGIADQIFLGMWLGGAGALISLILFCRNYRPIVWVAPTARKAFTAAKCLSARVPLHIRERLGKVSWRLPVAVGSIVIPGLLPWLSIWVVVTLMVVGVLPFVVGMKLAQQYFFETVIEPVFCHSLVTAKEHRRSVEVARAKTDPTPWKEHRDSLLIGRRRAALIWSSARRTEKRAASLPSTASCISATDLMLVVRLSRGCGNVLNTYRTCHRALFAGAAQSRAIAKCGCANRPHVSK